MTIHIPTDNDIILLIMTCGRKEYLERTMDSFDEMVGMQKIARVIVHDDSGISEFTDYLLETFAHAEIVSTKQPSGFGGAIRNAWNYIQETKQYGERYVFHLEEDFTFNELIDLADIRGHLSAYRAQIALKRQPWSMEEIVAGGFMELNPSAYKVMGNIIEHREFFTTNPCLYSVALTSLGWPEDPYSEGKFWHRIKNEGIPYGVRGDDVKCCYYTNRELVTHIGESRGNGFGY